MRATFTKMLGLVAAAMIALAPMAASAAPAVTSGTLTGENKHITTGGVQIVRTADGGAVVILDSDFSLDGAPDPRVGFGVDGEYDENTNLGVLKNLNGLQVYVVPPTVNVDDFNEVYIWCTKFSVSLGVATLK